MGVTQIGCPFYVRQVALAVSRGYRYGMAKIESKGRHLLAAEITSRTGGNKARAARELMVRSPSLLAWLDGSSRPRYLHRLIIEKWSHGAVPADSWMTEEEQAGLERALESFKAVSIDSEELVPQSDEDPQ